MPNLKTTTIALIGISIVLLFAFNAVAKAPPDPAQETNTPSGQASNCQTGGQNVTEDQIDNPSMALEWLPNNPPSEISPGETLPVAAAGGKASYTWTVVGNGITLSQGNITDKPFNEIIADCSASGTVTIILYDSKVDENGIALNEIVGTITVNPDPFFWDYQSTGTAAVARNSQKTIYVSGGYPQYTWTVSDPGYYFLDEELPVQEITTTSESVIIYTYDTVCGAANIQVTDECGNTVYGSVRCSSGKWSSQKFGCVFGGVDNYVYTGGSEYAYFNATKIEVGKYRQFQTLGGTWPGDFGQNCDRCPDNCEQAAAQEQSLQCEPCLEKRNDIPCRHVTFQGWQCTTYYVYYYKWECN